MTTVIPPPVSALIRSALFVRDRKRSKQFYQALGLTNLYFEGVLSHPSASEVLGLSEHRPYEVSIVKSKGPNFGMVGLFEIARPDTDEPVRSGPARCGESALVFYVDDLDVVLPALSAAGASWTGSAVTFELGHFCQREICLRDPDGFLLNLVERPPSGQLQSGPEMEFTPLD
ncbi:hypothetical protein J3369_00655 [Alteromonas sp. NFXS44]|uniref:VOC family protein n=1 Tax=Alteromonas sp. NFXS44 TaxID=2818435 RepID=UPI0032DE6889